MTIVNSVAMGLVEICHQGCPVSHDVHNMTMSTRSYALVSLCQIYCRMCTNVKILKFAPILVGEGMNHVNIIFELSSFSIIVR